MLAYWTDTETHKCQGGNQQLANRMAKGLADLRMRAAVVALEIRTRGVRVRVADGATDSYDDFDYAILATPPTVWPRIESAPRFHPEDYTMAHGPAVKHLSKFDGEFWHDSWLAPKALWDKLGSVWEGSDPGKQKGVVSSPSVRKPSLRRGVGLTVFSGGSFVLPDVNTYGERMESLYKGFAANVKGQWLVRWSDEPWIKTGYATPARGQVCTMGMNLNMPYQDRLYFAGEQASPGFYGYMEGALAAGLRAAGRVGLAISRAHARRRSQN
jgi:monoamine oxidase